MSENLKVSLSLNTIDRVRTFCETVTGLGYEVDVRRDRYIIDAKSLMGLFSLDLSKKLEIYPHCDEEQFKDFLECMRVKGLL